MESFERARLDAFFARVGAQFAASERPAAFLVTHLLADRPSFVRAVGSVAELCAVLPKPKSVDPAVRREVEAVAACDELSRELFAEVGSAVNYLESRAGGRDVVLLDMGGYFAGCLAEVCAPPRR